MRQLRQMKQAGTFRRVAHHQVPPKVEYGLTDWGRGVCAALTRCWPGPTPKRAREQAGKSSDAGCLSVVAETDIICAQWAKDLARLTGAL